MKKLVIMASIVMGIANFAGGCTNSGLEESYETEYETQAIDHKEVGDDKHDDKLMEGDPDRNPN